MRRVWFGWLILGVCVCVSIRLAPCAPIPTLPPPPTQNPKQPKGIGRWPHVLQYVASGAQLGPQASNAAQGGGCSNSRLALSALGGVAWQLRRSLIDVDLLSMQVRNKGKWGVGLVIVHLLLGGGGAVNNICRPSLSENESPRVPSTTDRPTTIMNTIIPPHQTFYPYAPPDDDSSSTTATTQATAMDVDGAAGGAGGGDDDAFFSSAAGPAVAMDVNGDGKEGDDGVSE